MGFLFKLDENSIAKMHFSKKIILVFFWNIRERRLIDARYRTDSLTSTSFVVFHLSRKSGNLSRISLISPHPRMARVETDPIHGRFNEFAHRTFCHPLSSLTITDQNEIFPNRSHFFKIFI